MARNTRKSRKSPSPSPTPPSSTPPSPVKASKHGKAPAKSTATKNKSARKSVTGENAPASAAAATAKKSAIQHKKSVTAARAALNDSTNAARVADGDIQQKLHDALTKVQKYKRLAKLQHRVPKPVIIIPRPKGNFSIQTEMKLTGKDELFRRIQKVIHNAIDESPLDQTLSWTQQTMDVRAKILQLAQDRAPILARYANGWATQRIAQQKLDNHRNYVKLDADPNSKLNQRRAEKGVKRRGRFSKAALQAEREFARANELLNDGGDDDGQQQAQPGPSRHRHALLAEDRRPRPKHHEEREDVLVEDEDLPGDDEISEDDELLDFGGDDDDDDDDDEGLDEDEEESD